MTGGEGEIVKLRQIKWRTSLSRQLSDFSEIIRDDMVFEKYFGEKYVERLAAKSKELTRIIIKLGVVYTILMLSLFVSQNMGRTEFEVFGYGFKNLGNYKELLLFLAVMISPVSAVLGLYQKYINALTNECLKKLAPDANIRKYYAHNYLDEYSDAFPNLDAGAHPMWHGFTRFLIASLMLMMVFLLLTLLAGSFFIQINVIYDVATSPATSHYINLFVITFSIASILFSWLVAITQLPMPEVDFSNYMKLSKLKDEDPVKYQEVMERLSKEDAKKNERVIVSMSIAIYIATFTAVSMYWFSSSLDDLSYFLAKAMPGAFLVMLLSYEIIKYVRKKALVWFFRKYPDESESRTQTFISMRKKYSWIKILIPFSISVGYALYALSPR